MPKNIVFVESTYGEVEKIYRRKNVEEDIYTVYLTLKNATKALYHEDLDEAYFEMIVSKEYLELFKDIAKGSFVTVKTAAGTIINVLEGNHLPEENTVEVIETKKLYGKV